MHSEEIAKTVEACRRRTEFELHGPDGMVYRALYFSPQIASAVIGAGVLGLIEAEKLSTDAKSLDPAQRQRAAAESNALVKAVLREAMTSPRLSEDDREFDLENGRIGYFALGPVAQQLYDKVMAGSGDAEVFRLSPVARVEQSSP